VACDAEEEQTVEEGSVGRVPSGENKRQDDKIRKFANTAHSIKQVSI
jgi:hypothetical protein